MANIGCGVGSAHYDLTKVLGPFYGHAYMDTYSWVVYDKGLLVKTGWRMVTEKTCHLMIELCAQISSQHNPRKDLHHDRLS